MMKPVLLGIHDMVLAAKVNSVARSLGVHTISTFTPHDLLSKAHGENPRLVILDLNEEHLHPIDSISQLKQDPHTSRVLILGFISENDDKTMKTAKEFGCDIVMGETQFLSSLRDILTGKMQISAIN